MPNSLYGKNEWKYMMKLLNTQAEKRKYDLKYYILFNMTLQQSLFP